jgi:hypothetical protein
MTKEYFASRQTRCSDVRDLLHRERAVVDCVPGVARHRSPAPSLVAIVE